MRVFRARRTVTSCTQNESEKASFAQCVKIKNIYFRFQCEKVILSSGGRLRPSEARVKRSHQDKITFSLVYRTQFFHTTCTKLDLTHVFLFERAQSGALRTECENSYFKYKFEKVILSSCRHLRPSEARVKRPHEDKPLSYSRIELNFFIHARSNKKACAKSSFVNIV